MSRKREDVPRLSDEELAALPTDPEPRPRETKADKFRRLAMRRVPRAIKDLGAIANLGNKAQYAWTPLQASTILAALDQSLQGIKARFNGTAETKDLFVL